MPFSDKKRNSGKYLQRMNCAAYSAAYLNALRCFSNPFAKEREWSV